MAKLIGNHVDVVKPKGVDQEDNWKHKFSSVNTEK